MNGAGIPGYDPSLPEHRRALDCLAAALASGSPAQLAERARLYWLSWVEVVRFRDAAIALGEQLPATPQRYRPNRAARRKHRARRPR